MAKQWKQLKEPIESLSPKFVALAKRFHINPTCLAFIACACFADHPPDKITIVADEPVDEFCFAEPIDAERRIFGGEKAENPLE